MVGLRKRKPIQCEFVELPSGMVLSEVDSLERLESLDSHEHIRIETKGEVFLVSAKGNMAFKYQKPKSMPHTIQVEKLELNPDRFTVNAQLNREELFKFALRESLFLFETSDGWYIPTGEVVFSAKKG